MDSMNSALVSVVVVLAIVLVLVVIAAIIAFIWLKKRAPPNLDKDAEYGTIVDEKWGEMAKAATTRDLSDQPVANIKLPKIENIAAFKNLEELILQDPNAASFIADALTTRAMDEVAQSLVVLFEAHNKGIYLIKYFIDAEMIRAHASEEGPGTLFRMESIASKIMRFYCKLVGHQYLTSVLWAQIRTVLLSDDFIELDDAKMKEGDSLIENLCNFQDVIANFLEAIINSSSDCPQQLRMICQHLSAKAMELFPYNHLKVVGGFIFLRFFTPAVMSPVSYGIIEGDLTANQSRTLVLVAKVLQNLANGLLFGDKEQYMMPMNEFLSANFPLVQTFLSDLATKNPKDTLEPVPISQEARLAALRVIHFNMLKFSNRFKRNANPALHEQIQVILKELDDYAAAPLQDQPSPTNSPKGNPSPPSERSSLPSRQNELPSHSVKTTSIRSSSTTSLEIPKTLPAVTPTQPVNIIQEPVNPPMRKKASSTNKTYVPNPRLYRPPSNPRSAELSQSIPVTYPNTLPRYSTPPKFPPQPRPGSPQYRFVSPSQAKKAPPLRSPSPKKQPSQLIPISLPSPVTKPATPKTPNIKKKVKTKTKTRDGSKSPTKKKKAKSSPTSPPKSVNINTDFNTANDIYFDDDDYNYKRNFDSPPMQARTSSLMSLDLSLSSLDNSVK